MCKRYRPRTPRSSDPSSLSVTLLEFLLFGRCTPEIYIYMLAGYPCAGYACVLTQTRGAQAATVDVSCMFGYRSFQSYCQRPREMAATFPRGC